MTDLQAKLRGSDSYASLRSEIAACGVLEASNWTVVHGAYYQDTRTDKAREVDVCASQRWERNLKNFHEKLDLSMLVECKSAKKFHLVFPCMPQDNFGIGSVYRQWLGYETTNRRVLLKAAQRSGLVAEQLATLDAELSRRAFPGGSALARAVMIDPPKLKWSATSFRETNIGSEKELEESILWKSTRALLSAVTSLKRARLRWHLDWIILDAETMQREGKDPMPSMIDSLTYQLWYVHQWHPVVLMEARLWALKGDAIREIPWCRFHENAIDGRATRWFDIVHASKFSEYVEMVSTHYQRALRRVKATFDATTD